NKTTLCTERCSNGSISPKPPVGTAECQPFGFCRIECYQGEPDLVDDGQEKFMTPAVVDFSRLSVCRLRHRSDRYVREGLRVLIADQYPEAQADGIFTASASEISPAPARGHTMLNRHACQFYAIEATIAAITCRHYLQRVQARRP
ncbi:hypothetical protein FOZ63_014373, partial [Perkinsus olseni]